MISRFNGLYSRIAKAVKRLIAVRLRKHLARSQVLTKDFHPTTSPTPLARF
jgi:hypothetical protein